MAVPLFTPRGFRVVGIATVCAVYFLILVGGIVRASGAGMGCPDWPKCFDRWIPPTNESQLPPDYQEIYRHRGYADTTFNVVKTWTEYVNRLIGVGIGFLIFLTMLSSLCFFRSDPLVTWLSIASFFLVGFQGWLGSVVVSTNLVPIVVTVHMVVALVLVVLLIHAVLRGQRDTARFGEMKAGHHVHWVLVVALALSLVQIVLGTQVRESIDSIASEMGQAARNHWVSQLGVAFYVHRTLSLLILAVNGYLVYHVWVNAQTRGLIQSCAAGVAAVVCVEIVTGALLYYLGMPAVLQPVHLVLASLMFGVQYLALISLRYSQPLRATDELA